MIGTLIGLILTIVVLGVIWWCVQRLLTLIPLPPWAAVFIEVIMVLIVCIIALWFIVALLGAIGVHVNMPIRLQ